MVLSLTFASIRIVVNLSYQNPIPSRIRLLHEISSRASTGHFYPSYQCTRTSSTAFHPHHASFSNLRCNYSPLPFCTVNASKSLPPHLVLLVHPLDHFQRHSQTPRRKRGTRFSCIICASFSRIRSSSLYCPCTICQRIYRERSRAFRPHK